MKTYSSLRSDIQERALIKRGMNLGRQAAISVLSSPPPSASLPEIGKYTLAAAAAGIASRAIRNSKARNQKRPIRIPPDDVQEATIRYLYEKYGAANDNDEFKRPRAKSSNKPFRIGVDRKRNSRLVQAGRQLVARVSAIGKKSKNNKGDAFKKMTATAAKIGKPIDKAIRAGRRAGFIARGKNPFKHENNLRRTRIASVKSAIAKHHRNPKKLSKLHDKLKTLKKSTASHVLAKKYSGVAKSHLGAAASTFALPGLGWAGAAAGGALGGPKGAMVGYSGGAALDTAAATAVAAHGVRAGSAAEKLKARTARK
jgi:hypothetical protein